MLSRSKNLPSGSATFQTFSMYDNITDLIPLKVDIEILDTLDLIAYDTYKVCMGL